MKLISLCCIAVLVLTSLSSAEEPMAPHSWKVSNLQGPVYGPRAKLTFTLSQERLTFADKKLGVVLDIPAQQVLSVVYTPTDFSRAYQVAGDKTGASGYWGPMSSGCAGGGEVGCGGMALLYAITLMIAAPMHGRSHYVRITWADRGVEQQLQFEASKEDHDALLGALKNLAGPSFLDLEAEAAEFQAELTQSAPNALALKLDKASKLGDFKLEPGSYRVLTLDRGEGRADVYVFSGDDAIKPDPAKVKASLRAHVCDSPSGESVEYLNGSAQIAAIQGDGKLVRFASE